jgi:hypothetical protein
MVDGMGSGASSQRDRTFPAARARAASLAGPPPCLRQRRPRQAARYVHAGEAGNSSAGRGGASGRGTQTPGTDGAPFASACRIVASVVGSHLDHLRPRQSRADTAPGVQVVRTVARSTWTPGAASAPHTCGSTADVMGVRVGGGSV